MILPHGDEVFAAAYRPDGRAVLTGGPSGSDPLRGVARLWDAWTGEALGPPLEHPGPVTSAAFGHTARPSSPARRRFGPGLGPCTGRVQGSVMTHPAAVRVVAVAPGGKTYLTAGGHAVRLWEAATRRPLPRPPTTRTRSTARPSAPTAAPS